jgi:hypothetical protein
MKNNNEVFEPNVYYRWLHGRGEIYLIRGDEHIFVEENQLFKGDYLNSCDNINELEFGCLVNWTPMPNKVYGSIDGHKLNEIVNGLTLEQCFRMLPNPSDKDNIDSIYPQITRHYIHNNGKWVLEINDWYGSKDQINLFSVHSDDILECLHSGILMCVLRGILPLDKLFDKM